MRVAIRHLHDWYRLLRAVYNPGIRKHEPIYVLGCANCGRPSGDIRQDPHAWDGWAIAPVHICPDCGESIQLPVGEDYPGIDGRRERYIEQLETVKNHGGKHAG